MGDRVSEAADLGDSVWGQAAEDFRHWRAGDRAALDDLVRRLTPVLWHVVRAYRLDQADAADVVQNTWVTFSRKHDTIQDPAAVGKWLTTCARREAARLASRSTETVAVDEPAMDAVLPRQRSAEEVALLSAEARELWRAVETLDARCQRLLRVVAFQQRPDYAGLADELDMPVGSIGPTRGRCLGKLKKALSSHDKAQFPEVDR